MRPTLLLLLILAGRCVAMDIFFSPSGGCTKAITDSLATIRGDSIFVQAYNFTSSPVGDALVRAKKAGNYVALIVDGKAAVQKGNQVAKCDSAGIMVYVDKKHPIAHNKVMIMGKRLLETGSFNYSTNAESKNAENIIFIPDSNVVKVYRKNWEAHKAHSLPYVKP